MTPTLMMLVSIYSISILGDMDDITQVGGILWIYCL